MVDVWQYFFDILKLYALALAFSAIFIPSLLLVAWLIYHALSRLDEMLIRRQERRKGF